MDDGGEGRGGGWDRQLAGSFSGHPLLEGEWDSLGLEAERDRAVALHHGLISLRCALAAVELRLGELFAHFAPGGRFTFEPLGAATREVGCQARLGISWALARQFIDLSRGLAGLPRSCEAFLLALVERSKLRWLVKVATPETEAGWLALAKRRGEKQLAADVRAFKERQDEASPARGWSWPDLPEPEPYLREYVRLTGSAAQAAAVRSWAFDVVRKIAGENYTAAECMEALCADAASGMEVEYPEPPDDDAEGAAGVRAVKIDEAKLRELAVTWRVQRVAVPIDLPDAAPDADFDTTWKALVRCVRLRDRALAERATLLYWLDGCSLWRHLGAKSLVAYAGHALGMPPKDLREGLRLRARLSMLSRVRKEWLGGMLSSHAARQLGNIAARDTEEEWVSHVERLTGKRLDAETRWQDLALHSLDLATWRRTTDGGRPQPSLAMHELRQSIEKMALRCVQDLDGDAPEVRAVLEPRAPLTSFGFWASPWVAAFVRRTLNEVRAGIGPTATDGDAILKLTSDLLELVSLDKPELSKEMAINREVFERDGWQCANPLCRARRNLHAHHVQFRSHGGCDEKWNKVTLCAACHLRLLHLSYLRITRARPAPAEDFIFELPRVGERYHEGVLVMA
jgi:hypothetical protein